MEENNPLNRKITRREALAIISGGIAGASIGGLAGSFSGLAGGSTPETDPLAILRSPIGQQTIQFVNPNLGSSALRIQDNGGNSIAFEVADFNLVNGFRFFPLNPFMSVVTAVGGDIFLAEFGTPTWGQEALAFPIMPVLAIGDLLSNGLGRQQITIGRFDVDANHVGADVLQLVTKTTGQIVLNNPTTKFGLSAANSLLEPPISQAWDLGTDGQVTAIDLGLTPVTLVSSGGLGLPPAALTGRQASGGVAKGWNRADHKHALPSGFLVVVNLDETQASATVPNTDTNLKTFSLGANTFLKVITESEGYIQIAAGATQQDVNIKIKYGATQVGQTMKFQAEALTTGSKIPFSIKASGLQTTAATIALTISAAAADANTTVFANSLRVYGQGPL